MATLAELFSSTLQVSKPNDSVKFISKLLNASFNPTTSTSIVSNNLATNEDVNLKGFVPANIEKMFKEEGINVKITSGLRTAGQAGKAGNKSHHITGNAVDIVPVDGDFKKLRSQIINNSRIMNFLQNNNLGILDESDPEMMARTGATGAHFHIGPDRIADRSFYQSNFQSNNTTEFNNNSSLIPERVLNFNTEQASKVPSTKDNSSNIKTSNFNLGNGQTLKFSSVTYEDALKSGKLTKKPIIKKNYGDKSDKDAFYREQEAVLFRYHVFYNALKARYGNNLNDKKIRQLTEYMVAQTLNEGNYTVKGNMGGMMLHGKIIKYDNLASGINDYFNTLKKWKYTEGNSLYDYVSSLYDGKYRYNANEWKNDNPDNGNNYHKDNQINKLMAIDDYYSKIAGCYARFSQYLRLNGIPVYGNYNYNGPTDSRGNRYRAPKKKSEGGKFDDIRNIYAETFNNYRR